MTQIDNSTESVENERSENDDTGEGETAAERGIRNHNYKASCTVCSKTLNHKSIVRHIKLVHGIDGKGKDYSVPLNEVPGSGNGEQPGAENHAVERNSSAPSNSNNSSPSVEENSTENLEDGINERENAIEEEPESETTEEVGTFVVTVPRSRHFEEKVICAKKEELQKFQKFGAFEVTRRPPGVKILGTSWVVTEKEKSGELVTKARLCVRGDQEENKHLIATDSPTVAKYNIRMLLMAAATEE